MRKRLTIAMLTIFMMFFGLGILLRVELPKYKEYVASNTNEVADDGAKYEYNAQGIVPKDDVEDDALDTTSSDISPSKTTSSVSAEPKTYRGEKKTSRGGTYSAMSVTSSVGDNGEAVYTADNGVTIKIMQGDSSTYLTNRSVLLNIHYPAGVEKTLKIGGGETRTLSDIIGEKPEEDKKLSGEFNHVVRVRENVDVIAGGARFDVIKNIVEIKTGCEVYEDSSNSANNNGYVKNKTYYSARLGGIITNSEGVSFTSGNIVELGVRYWRSDMDDEIYTVKNTMGASNDNFKIVENREGKLRFEILARSLKENTTYYMQAYMINKDNEVLLGDVKEFATRGQGIGLYGLYYNSINSSNPIIIKQETVDTMKFTGLNQKRVRWVGEIVPVNNGVMKFRTTTDASGGSIIISNGDRDIYKGESDSTVDTLPLSGGTTEHMYVAGKKYQIIIEVYKESGNFNNFKLEWMEDRGYQEVPKTQLYPKEYVKISSAVINSVGTDKQTIANNGKLINKKVITNGQNMTSCSIGYSNDVASTVTIGGRTYTIIHENNSAHRVGATLPSTNNLCTIEGWIVYNTNNVVEPIIENVSSINYSNNKVTLRNGSEWALYADKGVDMVGRVVVRKEDGKEVYKVYDLGRYIINGSSKLSDGESYNSDKVYKTVEEDDTHVVNLTQELGESDIYQKTLNQYSTMEHFVEDSKPVSKKWNLGIGEGRVFSLVPIRMLLSFDGDDQFTMSDPVIKISKNLYRIKNGATAKDGENVVDPSSKDNIFWLDFPTDVKKKTDEKKWVRSQKYADWRYMDADGKEGSDKHDVKMVDDGEYITITLEGLDVNKEAKDAPGATNVMLNFVMRIDSVGSYKDKTSDEIFDAIPLTNGSKLVNDSYKTFTDVAVVSVGTSQSDTANVKIERLPVEIKIKPQVTFE